MTDCLFCKIISKDIPSTAIYEDVSVYAFLDIHPVNPGHVLVVPKKHVEGFPEAETGELTTLIISMQKIAKALLASGVCEAFNIEQNNGVIAGQVIPHLHFHLIPRLPDDGLRHWPGKEYGEGEYGAIAERIAAALRAS